MAYFPHAYQKVLVATDGFNATPGHSITLESTPGKVAVVDSKTNLIEDLSQAPTSTQVYLAQGSFYANDKIGPYHGGYKESVKSKFINPKYVSAFYVTTPAAATANILNVSVDDCTDIACNTTYRLRLDVKGSPALRFLTRNSYLTLDGFSGCCDVDSNNVDPNVVLLQWMDQINDSPLMSSFVQAKVWSDLNLDTPITATMTAATSITVTERTGIVAGQKVVFTPTTATSATTSSILGDVFTVGTATNTIFSVGQTITGTGVTADTVITAWISGGGGTGSTFRVSKSQTVASATISSTDPVLAFVAVGHTPATGSGAVLLKVASTLTAPTTTTISAVTTTAGTAVQVYESIETATYTARTGATLPDTNDAYLELLSAYASTTFGDCSFDPIDHFELEPLQIYASVVDETGDPCNTTCFTVTEVQAAYQGKGFGEPLVRELILAKRYRQESFSTDPRMRDILGDTVLSEIDRTAKYYVYHILHSVPRKSNPSGMMDSDQYLIKVVAESRNSDFETYFDALLTAAGNDVQLEEKL